MSCECVVNRLEGGGDFEYKNESKRKNEIFFIKTSVFEKIVFYCSSFKIILYYYLYLTYYIIFEMHKSLQSNNNIIQCYIIYIWYIMYIIILYVLYYITYLYLYILLNYIMLLLDCRFLCTSNIIYVYIYIYIIYIMYMYINNNVT